MDKMNGPPLEDYHHKFKPFLRIDRYGPMGIRVTRCAIRSAFCAFFPMSVVDSFAERRWTLPIDRLDMIQMALFWLTGIPVLRLVISLYALISFYVVCSLAQYLPLSTRNR